MEHVRLRLCLSYMLLYHVGFLSFMVSVGGFDGWPLVCS